MSESQQAFSRPLLTPGEVLQLPSDEALVMVGGMPPYRAKKIMYYLDKRLNSRVNLPPPDDPQAQASELLPREASPWAALPPRPDAAALRGPPPQEEEEAPWAMEAPSPAPMPPGDLKSAGPFAEEACTLEEGLFDASAVAPREEPALRPPASLADREEGLSSGRAPQRMNREVDISL
jgi:hypothetical protein